MAIDSWGECINYSKSDGIRRRCGKTKSFKKGGKLSKDVDTLKREAVTPLHIMQQGQVQVMQYNQTCLQHDKNPA